MNSNLTLSEAYRQAVSAEPPEVAGLLRTPKEMRSKLSKRRRKDIPLVPAVLQDIDIPEHFRQLNYPGLQPGEENTLVPFFQEKLVVMNGINNEVNLPNRDVECI